MHIVFISNLYPPETIGGAERYVQTVAERIADDGHSVSVLTTTADSNASRLGFETERQSGVAVHRVRPLNCYAPYEYADAPTWQKPIEHLVDVWNPQMYFLFRQELSGLDPDVVHSHNLIGLSPAVLSAAAGQGYPVVHTLHDYELIHPHPSMFVRNRIWEPRHLLAPYRMAYRRWVEPHVDCVLSPSRFVVDKHREAGIFRETDCYTVRLGVDRSELTAPGAAARAIDDGPLRLLYVGQLTRSKGVDLLVDAAKSLPETDLRIDIVGKGPQADALRRRARGDERIEFHGFVSEAELDSFYQTAHSVVVPSRWYENSPMVIYESYARGTPVIGARIGGVPELIEEGATGYLFEPGSVTGLARTIREAQSTLDVEMFECASALGERFTLDRHLGELQGVYRELVDVDPS